MQELQMSNEDVHRVHINDVQKSATFSHYRKQFQTSKLKATAAFMKAIQPHHDSKNFMPHIRHMQHFQPPPHQQPSMHSGQQYIQQQQNYNQPTNGVYPGQYDQQQNYDQSFESTQKPNPVYGHGYGANKPRELMQIIGALATGEIDRSHTPTRYKGSWICTICQRLHVEQRKVLRSGVLPECVCDNDLCVPIRRVLCLEHSCASN